MKEKVQEFEISMDFHFPANMTIEAESEKEALKIAQKHYLEVIRDYLRDRDNLNIKVKSKHVITEEERTKLENEGIIEPHKLTARQQAKLEREKARKAFAEEQARQVKQRKQRKIRK